MTFRYSNGVERKMIKAVSSTLDKTLYYHSTTKSSDATFAVKFLKTRVESEIGSAKQVYSKFVAGHLCLAVICSEQVDNRLVEYFAADDHLPVNIISIEIGTDEQKSQLRNILFEEFDRMSPIDPSPLSKARMETIYNALQKRPSTGVPSKLYDEMLESYMKTPDHQKRTWHKNLCDRNGNATRVVYQNGKLYEANGAFKLKEILSVSEVKMRNATVISEWGENFVLY